MSPTAEETRTKFHKLHPFVVLIDRAYQHDHSYQPRRFASLLTAAYSGRKVLDETTGTVREGPELARTIREWEMRRTTA